MKQHKLGFGNRSHLEQLAICRRIADSIAALPEDQRAVLANHPVADRTAEAVAALAEVARLKTALKGALRLRDEKMRAARHSATYAALGIFNLTAGEPAALLAAGVDIARDKLPVGLPATPQNVRAEESRFEGRVRLRWKRTVRRCVFQIQATTDASAATGWKIVDSTHRQSCEVEGLESGVKYWFRIAAINAHGHGPWSPAVSARAK